jgi:AraC family transcriptional regulator, ethanolamine operon transcriptional activator
MVVHAGPIRAEFISAQVGDIIASMGEYSFPLATRGESLDERVGFALVSARMSSAQMNGQPMTSGVARVFGGAAEVAGAGGPLQFVTISFRPADLERGARQLGVEVDLPSRGKSDSIVVVDEVRLRRVLRDLRTSVRETGRSAASVEEAERIADALMEIAVRSLASDRDGDVRKRHVRPNCARVVRACEEFAASANYQGVTLAGLCGAAGVSERRVRQAFYDCFGMSPTAYLRVAALNEVRRELVEGAPRHDAVTRAAADFGFWHLSRFAGQYRALFGESPSTTVAQRSTRSVS